MRRSAGTILGLLVLGLGVTSPVTAQTFSSGSTGVPKGVYTSTLAVFSDTGGRMVDERYRHLGASFISEYDRTKWLLGHHDVHEDVLARIRQRRSACDEL